jgi:hypothetical protein
MIYIEKGKENNVVTDWYSQSTNSLDIRIDGKYITHIEPIYANGKMYATFEVPDSTQIGEHLIE